MPRPRCDIESLEYQNILRARAAYRNYGHDYKDVLWMEDTLKRLEKKLYHDDQDQSDFLKVKDIYARVFEKRRGETAENHTTPQYIWRTAGDGKVRRSHAANNGKIFSWNNPPPTGHPGETYGCRCWAEAYKPETLDTEEMQEKRIQRVTSIVNDLLPSWSREDFLKYFFSEERKKRQGSAMDMVTLSEIGHLQNVIDCAKFYNQGEGSIFERVENEICEKAQRIGSGLLPYYFENSYEFGDYVWALGGATVKGTGQISVTVKDEFLIIAANIVYHFSDIFSDPYDIYDVIPGEINFGGVPYHIRDTWSTNFEAIIKKVT